jgi:hypothetical protein
MQEITRTIISGLTPFSKGLNSNDLFIDKPWILIEGFTKEKLIFRADNQLMIVNNGSVKLGKWEFIPSLNSILIDRIVEKLLIKAQFITESVMIFSKEDAAINKSLLIFVNEDLIPNLDYESYIISFGTKLNIGGMKIGDKYGGGIIFYIEGTSPGAHGLIVSIEMLEHGIWTDYGNKIPRGIEEGNDGNYNSSLLLKPNGYTSTIYPVKACNDYRGGGYSDWFLPSRWQLRKLYDQKELIKTLVKDMNYFSSYWSSNASGSYSLSYGMVFNSGEIIHSFFGSTWIGDTCGTRAIRSF